MGPKERARKQQEATVKAARQYVWRKKVNLNVITITDMEIEAYKEGAKVWQDKGNNLVETVQGLIKQLRDIGDIVTTDVCNQLTAAIKEFDNLKPCTTS